MKRPTFEELVAEAGKFIGPPQPPKMQPRDDGRDLTREELAAMPDMLRRFQDGDRSSNS